jgi:hypothetical protein
VLVGGLLKIIMIYNTEAFITFLFGSLESLFTMDKALVVISPYL